MNNYLLQLLILKQNNHEFEIIMIHSAFFICFKLNFSFF